MIDRIDHFVLTVRSVEATLAFYERVLGMMPQRNTDRPSALLFGRQKINVHQADHTFEPKADWPTEGSADFCLVTSVSMEAVRDRLNTYGIAVELGPVKRDGALGAMTSVYVRDPDRNLVEVSVYDV